MSRRTPAWPIIPVLLFAAACSDAPPATGPEDSALLNRAPAKAGVPAVQGMFHRFVSIGTSVSMGWQSDGAIASTQSESWNAQLARRAGREQSAPLLDGAGCRSPLIAPLALGKRLSGEGAATDPALFSCSELVAGMATPSQNVSIAASKTFDVLYTTPETQQDAFYKKLYPRILPSHTSQLHAALAQKPKFISVETGANDILDARIGIAIVGATITPFETWAPLFSALADTVADNVKHGIFVSLINDAATFPGFRRGSEIWNDRSDLLSKFYVQVDLDCMDSDNLLFVPFLVPTAAAKGAAQARAGLAPHVFSCKEGDFDKADFILTPDEVNVVNTQMAKMNAHIVATAEKHGFAVMSLEALYGRSNLKESFSSWTLLMTSEPYGRYISLDGIHPSTLGHSVLASAAVSAITQHYGVRFPPPNALITQR